MKKNPDVLFDRTVFLFHGGGALGAYQVGVVDALSNHGILPDWVIGTSIGAINSAIIAGNEPKQRVKKLRGFWETIATPMPETPNTLNNVFMERWHNSFSAQYTACMGQAGFFTPRSWNPWYSIQSTADKLSYYDTTELRTTLPQFIDFDYLNEKHVRLSMGAVHVATGQLVYFDNTKMELNLEHVMASCALPPGFPAVCVDNQFFWDGGLHSNTQLNLLLCEEKPVRYLCFMVHLFDSYGTRPTNMDDVYKRQKDIAYSSHHKQAIYIYRNIHNLRHAIRVLGENLSQKKLEDPELQKLLAMGNDAIIHLVRFHYKGKLSDLSTKDFEFSISSIKDHFRAGFDDVERAFRDPPWYKPQAKDLGLFLYEIADAPVADEYSLFEEAANYHRIT